MTVILTLDSTSLAREVPKWQGNGPSMEVLKHSLEILPPDWTSYLDANSFLQLQGADSSSFSDVQCIESFWRNLCRNELRQFLVPSVALDMHLDAGSVKHALQGGVGGVVEKRELTKYERQRLWSKAYRDVTGSLSTTTGNELRHDTRDFKPPALLDAPPSSEEQIAYLLNELHFKKDNFDYFTSVRLLARLGGDRCVIAKLPLPRLGVATAFPGPQGWQIAWRPCSYYEVEIRAALEKPGEAIFPRRAARSECVSVGLALATIPLRGICRQQAGWNHSSWALHGDDGQLYHSHGLGTPFQALKSFTLGTSPAQADSSVIDLTKEEAGTNLRSCLAVSTCICSFQHLSSLFWEDV